MLLTLACIASVSVGLSVSLKHFSLLNARKLTRAQRSARRGRGREEISVALAPIFAPPKSDKCLEQAEKPTETLATQAIFCGHCDWPE